MPAKFYTVVCFEFWLNFQWFVGIATFKNE